MGGWELGREENYRKMHHLLALGNSKHWDSRKDKCPELYVMPLIFETYGCCHNEVKRKCLPCKKKCICRSFAEFFRIVFSFYFRLIIEDTHWKQVERLHLVQTQPNPTYHFLKLKSFSPSRFQSLYMVLDTLTLVVEMILPLPPLLGTS